ncbi:MAG: potassium-transporting ATPase subunit F [Methylococcales bacterium]
MREIKGAIMNWLYVLSGGLAVAVFIYLLVALFYPE